MKQHETVKPFEFLLKINDNIICQRYFNIRNYNEDCRESIEIKEMIDEITGMNEFIDLGILPTFFKTKCMTSLWEGYNPHYYQSRTKTYTKNIFDKQDTFTFEVLVEKEVVASSTFDGSLFQSGVRRNINIREIIPTIIRVIGEYMSRAEYTHEDGGVSLSRHNKFDWNLIPENY